MHSAHAPRPWILAESTWEEIKRSPRELAVLPWGATEAHNYHLPYATDNYEVESVAAEAGAVAWRNGARIVVLPTVPFGVQTGQLDIPFCINMNPSTQAMLLDDIARTLEAQKVRKLVLLNGHGGNDFKAIIRELQPRVDIFLCVINWYSCVDPSSYFDEPGDHGGELETSVMQYVAHSFVRPLEQAGDGVERISRVRAFREGWAWAPRPWTRVSEDTGIGNPRAANRGKGEAFFGAVVERIGEFLTELAAADAHSLYE